MSKAQQQQRQQKLPSHNHSYLLSEYGALLMEHCRQIQQALKDTGQTDAAAVGCGDSDGDERVSGTTSRLRAALQVLAMHSGYSGRFFDLFKSELRACLSKEAGAQARLALHREASRLLKEVCLRSKEMSHDVIKASRELMHSFKSEQRVDDRRRSGSILSRAREIAKATIGRRSVSRNGVTATEPQASEPEAAHTQLTPPPPTAQHSPAPASQVVHRSPHPALVDLERSPRVRSSQRGRADAQMLQPPPQHKPQQQPKQSAPPASVQRVPAPPRRSSSLNSLPPEVQSAMPIGKTQRQQQQQHPHFQPQEGGHQSSRLQSTENCLKIVLSGDRHQLMRAPPHHPPPQLQSHQTPPAANVTHRSAGSSAASSAGTAELPSDASVSPAEVKNRATDNKLGAEGIRGSGAKITPQLSVKAPRKNCHSDITEIDARQSELDEDTVTKVTDLADDETSFFNNTSEILSTSVAADWATPLMAPHQLPRVPKPAEPVTDSATEPIKGEATEAAAAVGAVVRQRKSATLTTTSSASGGASSSSMKPRQPHQQQRRRRQLSSRKAPPLLSIGGRHHQHHRHQSGNMFSDSSDGSGCEAPTAFSKAVGAKSPTSVAGEVAAVPAELIGSKLLASGFRETDL